MFKYHKIYLDKLSCLISSERLVIAELPNINI